jgi:hypothetical protein
MLSRFESIVLSYGAPGKQGETRSVSHDIRKFMRESIIQFFLSETFPLFSLQFSSSTQSKTEMFFLFRFPHVSFYFPSIQSFVFEAKIVVDTPRLLTAHSQAMLSFAFLPSVKPFMLTVLCQLHRKKRFASFPSPAGMSLPNSPWAGIMTS